MAMLKTDESIIDINGKFAGTTFRKDQCGLHQQAYYYQRRPPSPKQRSRQKWFQKIVNQWRFHDGTIENANKWWQYSANHPVKNKKGEKRYLSPLPAYMQYNLYRLANGLDIQATPPED